MKTLPSFPSSQALLLGLLFCLCGVSALAQETRSTILGTVRDTAGAVVPGATVEVINTDTNTATRLTTNDSGYFEAPYLLPGSYNITVAATGFKKYVQSRYTLTVNSRQNLDVALQAGGIDETVTVTASAPLLETTTGSGTASLEQRQISDLPVLSNSAMLLARTVPGIQWTAESNYLALHSNIGASAVSAAGGVGGNEFSLDGVPNLAGGRRAGYLPYTDTIAEFKVETAPFDASKGHTTSATISLSTKSGTNDYHGALTWQHWQQRFNATQSTTNGAHWARIRQAEGAGDSALAESLKARSPQETGRSNNWAGSVGGPVRVPWLFNGRDKLFFFFSYNGFKDVKTEPPTGVNRTVPSDAHRRGDFSDLLRLDPVRYQIYDPRTARQVTGGICGTNVTCVVRDPFPNNQVPIINPLYKFYEALYPRANNVPGVVSAEGRNNYLASGTPFNWNYKALTNRVDYQLTPKQRMFGKWNYSNFGPDDTGDWTYETARGLRSLGLVRKNIGVTLDHVYTFNSTTIFNWSVAWNRFIEGFASNAAQSIAPSAVGLPRYLDEKAGPYIHLPSLDFSDYSDFPRGYPGFTRFSVGTVRGELSKYLGTHAVRIGVDLRQNWRASFNPAQSSGLFTYNNAFVRQAQNTANAGVLGLEWAAFMLGTPSTVLINTNDDLYLSNKFYAGYVQDDWKVSRRLTVNLGLRYELEGGFRERFNRGLTGFDLEAPLPITAGAQAAYATLTVPSTALFPLLPASQFVVKGGTTFLGKDGAPETVNSSQPGWMPRVGFAYQLNDKTVLRGGWGLFFDTNNVLNDGLDQSGYSRNTTTTITTNNGLTFENTNLTSPECRANIANCRTLLADPFPVRPNGTRFNTPLGNTLGLMALQGRGLTFLDHGWERARQHRYRLGLQRRLGGSMVAEIAYLGSRTDQIQVGRRLDALPEQYWASGLVRNTALANELSSQLRNPFHLRNFAALQTSHPVVYAELQAIPFFNNDTLSKAQLLRPYPNMNGLTNGRDPSGERVYNHLEATLTKRFAQGYSLLVSYMWASNLVRDVRENEFDEQLVRQPSNNAAPHSLNLNFIYEFPFGKGKKFLAGNQWANALLGGWQMGGIYNKQSGRVIELGNWFYYGNDLRAIAKDTRKQSVSEWFNWQLFPGASRDYAALTCGNPNAREAWESRIRTLVPASVVAQLPSRNVPVCNASGAQTGTRSEAASFDNVIPTDFQPQAFHRRVFPVRLNWLRGHGKNQFDFNLLRRFPITEKQRLEFRLDLINALNHVLWDNPNNDINSSNFGRVTNQWNTPRWLQFQLRYTF